MNKLLLISFAICLFWSAPTLGQKLKFGADSGDDANTCELNISASTMSGKPREGEQIIVSSETVKEVFKGYTSAEGKLMVEVPQGHTYHISFRSINEMNDYKDLEIPKVDGHLVFDFSMSWDFKKSVYVLKNVYFDTGTAHLKPSSSKALDELLDVLVHKTHLALEISGHTDNVASTITT